MSPLHQVLGNNLLASITNFTVRFGVTFWAFIESYAIQYKPFRAWQEIAIISALSI